MLVVSSEKLGRITMIQLMHCVRDFQIAFSGVRHYGFTRSSAVVEYEMRSWCVKIICWKVRESVGALSSEGDHQWSSINICSIFISSLEKRLSSKLVNFGEDTKLFRKERLTWKFLKIECMGNKMVNKLQCRWSDEVLNLFISKGKITTGED